MTSEAIEAAIEDVAGSQAEVAELRAYKERTEAALWEFTSELSNYGGVPTNYYQQELRRLGLWRDKEPKLKETP